MLHTAGVMNHSVCVGHLGSVILSLSHFCISAWLMGADTKLIGPSLWGRGLLWARLWARSSFCLLGITFPSSPSSPSSSSSSGRGVEFRKVLSLRVMMSPTASFSLSNHRASSTVSHGTHFTLKRCIYTSNHKWPQHPQKEKSVLSNALGKTNSSTHKYTLANLVSFSCSVFCEALLMPSQRSRSLSLHTGGGTNWCTLATTGRWWARLDARSSLRTSGSFRISASSSPSEDESRVDFWALKKSLSQRRMMFGDGDLTPWSSVVGGLGLEMSGQSHFRH